MRTRYGIVLITIALFALEARAQTQQSGRSQPGRLVITAANASDSKAPEILVIEPRKMRGITLKEKAPAITVRGRVIDDSAITSFTVNDRLVALDVDGWFETSVPLRMGEQTLVLHAVDAAGNLGTDTIPIEREAAVTIAGKYHALVIGINDYTGVWPSLDNAVHDAEAVAEVLRTDYGFDNVTTLINEQATRRNIISSVEWFADNVAPEDNLLIYYSGHGQFDERFNRGYWVPYDARTTSTADFVPNTDIQTYIRSIETQHTLLIADACFAGDVFRAGPTATAPMVGTPEYYQQMVDRPSRRAITSGGVEPVMDGGREGHSVFTYYLLKALRENQEPYVDANQIFERLRIPVINNSDQTPVFNPIRDAGDEGGQFVFARR